MKRKKYTDPVKQFLYLGNPKVSSYLPNEWPNYVEAYGLTKSDIPQLFEMASDMELNFADTESKKVWAPIHAVRALAQLHTEEVVDGLLNLWLELEDDEWMNEMILGAFIELGELAIPSLKTFFEDHRDEDIVLSIPEAFGKMPVKYPNLRNKCINFLKEKLQRYGRQSPELNSFLIWALTDLRATNALPLIKKAFMDDCVDEMIVGDWRSVRYEISQESKHKFSAKKSVLENLIMKKPK
jgi:hypothetical protein